MFSSKYLGSLDVDARASLQQRLLSRQSGRCFICDDAIDVPCRPWRGAGRLVRARHLALEAGV